MKQSETQKRQDQAETLLSLKNLKSYFHLEENLIKAVNGVTFQVKKNEIVGIVGESGSGKSVTALSILRLLPTPPCQLSGEIRFQGRDLLQISERQMQDVRGGEISMIFQEPMTSLNPVLSIGYQIAESIRLHQHLQKRSAWDKAVEMLNLVKIPEAARRARQYPHELSGGMRQRAMIAMALSSNPALLIADEPTTALDVTTQKQILYLIKDLQHQLGTSVMFITHNLGVVAEIADHVAIMYAGRLLEYGEVHDIFHYPKHPYSLCLLRSIPRLDASKNLRLEEIPGRVPALNELPQGCIFHPRCPYAIERCREQEPPYTQVDDGHLTMCWRYDQLPQPDKKVSEPANLSAARETSAMSALRVVHLKKYFSVKKIEMLGKAGIVKAVDDVSFEVKQGEVLGLVGESGCGKTTLGMCILRLLEATEGQILINGRDVTSLAEREMTAMRQHLQVIFQDPYGSLNPRMKIGQIVGEPLLVHKLTANPQEKQAKIIDMLEKVGLDRIHIDKYPHELSGGQRQRIAIARALIVSPKIVICDEAVSALDVSIQAQIINLLKELQTTLHLTYLFISHDVSVVKHISDRIAIMYLGKMVELAAAETVCQTPKHPYTQALISSVPIPDPEKKPEYIALKDEIPSPMHIPPGCRFHPRCPFMQERCRTEEPEFREISQGWFAACHFA
ncbi:glutathione import ATP-binding protein GsiA [Candidatus Vecturithrix granuli]|uniref:Glutathione import ATP-binding protein GsiA n=1 Tax=Vecturithrix granuli TaxID=1499967 RepID=A0A081C0Y2_VECG1|nr:glutathione import ATP-binding protein GsiA [Candidatus Vecturithrix granuli]